MRSRVVERSLALEPISMERSVPSLKWKTTASAACIPRRDSTSPYSIAATFFPTVSRIVCSLCSGVGGPIILGCSPLLPCWLSIHAPLTSCGRPLPSDTAHILPLLGCVPRPRAIKRRQARYKRLLAHVLDGVYPQETGTSSPRSRRASLSYGNRPRAPQAVCCAAALLRALVRAFIVSGGPGKGLPFDPARTQSQPCKNTSPLSGL